MAQRVAAGRDRARDRARRHAAWLWLGGQAGAGGRRLRARWRWSRTAQAARADARGAIAGETAAFDRLAASRSEIAKQRAAAGSGQSAERTFAAAGAWSALDRGLGPRSVVRVSHCSTCMPRASGCWSSAPQLLAATGNLVSALPAADLAADRPYLDRFELTVEGVRQNVRALGVGTDIDDSVQRLNDAGQYLSQIIRGLRGEDTTLGMTPVRGQTAQANLDSATRLFEDARAAIAAIVAGAAGSAQPTPRRRPLTRRRAHCSPTIGVWISAPRARRPISATRHSCCSRSRCCSWWCWS